MKDNLLVYMSLPFTLGVGIVSFIPIFHDKPWMCLFIISTLLSICLLHFCLSKRHTSLNIMASFCLLGCLCGATEPLLFRESQLPDFIKGCAIALKESISSIPFADKECRALLIALLCGDRSELSAITISNFQKSGAAHLLALSGLHLGVIASILEKLLKPLGNNRIMLIIRNLTIIFLSGFYTLICGANASLVRAFLFISFRSIGKLFPNRKVSAENNLMTACLLQLLFHPSAILTASFQLSYLACIGIVFIHPRLCSWLPISEGPISKLWKSLSLSISCQLCTAPIAFIHFHTFPKYFLLTNLLTLPACELLICAGLLLITANALAIKHGALLFVTEKTGQYMMYILRQISGMD